MLHGVLEWLGGFTQGKKIVGALLLTCLALEVMVTLEVRVERAAAAREAGLEAALEASASAEAGVGVDERLRSVFEVMAYVRGEAARRGMPLSDDTTYLMAFWLMDVADETGTAVPRTGKRRRRVK